MRLAFLSDDIDPRLATLRRRGPVVLLVLLAHLLIVFALLTLAPRRSGPFGGVPSFISMTFVPEPKAEKAQKKVEQKVEKKRTAIHAPSPAPVPPPPTADSARLHLLDIDLASSDIAKLGSKKSVETADAQEGADSGAVSGQTGPHGERLYNAEWQREPTDAELGYYLPKDRRVVGWGLIACRTVPRFRVEDCVALDESPAGSGIAQAVLNAAWQFRVLPPRLGGKAMVGEWVRIHIQFSEKPA